MSFAGSAQMLADVQSFKASPVVEVANCMYLCMRVLAGFAQGRRRDLKVRLHMRDVEYGCRNRRGQSHRACTMAPAGSGAVYCESSQFKGYARTIKEEQACLICKKHTFTNAREEIQKTIAPAKYNSRTNGECSSQPSAAGSHQPTGNRKQPPECASDAGGGDDGVDGYDDDDVFS